MDDEKPKNSRDIKAEKRIQANHRNSTPIFDLEARQRNSDYMKHIQKIRPLESENENNEGKVKVKMAPVIINRARPVSRASRVTGSTVSAGQDICGRRRFDRCAAGLGLARRRAFRNRSIIAIFLPRRRGPAIRNWQERLSALRGPFRSRGVLAVWRMS